MWVGQVLPEEEWVRERAQKMLQMVLEVDSRPSTHPLQMIGLQHTSDQMIMFDSITYHKGEIRDMFFHSELRFKGSIRNGVQIIYVYPFLRTMAIMQGHNPVMYSYRQTPQIQHYRLRVYKDRIAASAS